jgi:tetratricopeptide (TPR) repeat protein
MESTFKVTVLGIQPDRDPKEARDQLRPMLTNDDVAFDKIFHSITHNKPIILTAGIPQAGAENLAEMLTAIGLECRLDPMTLTLLPIDDYPRAIYRCPACGHYQLIAEDSQPDICQKCGVVGSNYEEVREQISNRNLMIERKSQRNLIAARKGGLSILGLLSLTVAFIGIGMLLWQWNDVPDAGPTTPPPPRLPLTTATPAPGAGAPATATGDPQITGAASFTPAAKPEPETASTAPAPAQPVPLLDADLLPAAPPPDDPDSGTIANPVAHDPQLLAELARYQLQTGDLAAATRSIDRAIALLDLQRDHRPLDQLEAFMRAQVGAQAEIARQHYQQGDEATAQTYWLAATRLANTISIPEERAPAFSGLARMMSDGEPTTAGTYFSRAIEVTRLIEEPLAQAVARGAVARDLARAERPEQARDLFERALAAVAAAPDPESRRVARTILAKHHAEAGDAAAANALLAQAAAAQGSRMSPELSRHRAEALGALALTLAQEPDKTMTRTEFAMALEQIQTLADPTLRAGTLLSLARDMAAAGDLETAAKLAAAAGSWD